MDRTRYMIEAYRPAMDAADKSSLPQTVFYHADIGWSHLDATNPRLRGPGMERALTWLPSGWFA